MTTQYTTILKLALPVQGELSGTWGDVVNDNITQMVEQAVAGKAVINTWTGNSHTLTTADGTTSESRCAILELTDSGTALTGAGTVVCPTNTKLYIVDNNTAEIVTVKTSGGTGVAVPVGKTMLVYCDGTNVVEGVTHANSLSLGTSTVTADKILDEDNMASDSATAIATQQSIKAYVDSQVGTVDTLSEILANGNVTGANDIDVENAQKVQFRDAAIYLNSSVDGQLDIVADGEVQIDTALVDINGNLDVSGTTNISGSVSFTKNAIAGVAISTTSRSSNTVTVTTSAVHGLTSGDLVNVNGVADRSFNGYFTVSVSSTTVFTYSQTGADENSTGGTSTEIVYNLNASGTALNQMNGPLNIAANSGIDGLEITQSGSGEALSITGGNAIFGDNDKAIFGIGNDLQIYHDGSHSYIKDAGDGQLRLLAGTNVQIWNSDATSLAANFNGDTQTSLYYAGAAKLATSSSGISVTGGFTATAASTITTADNSTQLTLISTDADASAGPVLDLYRNSASPANNDFLGNITFRGRNNNSQDVQFAEVEVYVTDVADGAEDGLVNYNVMTNGSNLSYLQLRGETATVVINEDGADIDFRVESDSNANMLFVDGGANRVGVGTAAPQQVMHLVNGGLQVSGQIISPASGQSAAYFDYSSGGARVWSRGDASTRGTINFYQLENDGGNQITSLSFDTAGAATFNSTVTIGSNLLVEDIKAKGSGGLTLQTDEGVKRIIIEDDGDVVINETGVSSDFRVESDNSSSMLFVDASTDRVGVGVAAPTNTFDVQSSDTNAVRIRGTSNVPLYSYGDGGGVGWATGPTTNYGELIYLDETNSKISLYTGGVQRFVVGAAATVFNENSANTDFRVESDTNANGLMLDASTSTVGVNRAASSAVALSVNATATNSSTYALEACNSSSNTKFIVRSDGYIGFYKTGNAAGLIHNTDGAITITPDAGGHFVFNQDGVDVDFRVESRDNANMVFVNGENNSVTIGGSADDGAQFYVNGNIRRGSYTTLSNFNSNNDVLAFNYKIATSASTVTPIYSGGSSAGGSFIHMESGGGGTLDFRAAIHGTDASAFTYTEAGKYLTMRPTSKTGGELVVNQDGGVIDFRVETDATSNGFVVNAGSGTVCVGRSNTWAFSTNTTPGFAVNVTSGRLDVSADSVARITQINDATGTYDRFYRGSSIVGSITTDGSNTAYNTSSDQRLKENIADADDAGSKIDSIQVRKYDWKADGSHQDYGMIAQELQAVAPEAVSGDADSDEMMGVDYSKLVPMLIKEIQSLRARVADLES